MARQNYSINFYIWTLNLKIRIFGLEVNEKTIHLRSMDKKTYFLFLVLDTKIFLWRQFLNLNSCLNLTKKKKILLKDVNIIQSIFLGRCLQYNMPCDAFIFGFQNLTSAQISPNKIQLLWMSVKTLLMLYQIFL